MGGERCGGDIWYDRAHNIVYDTLVSGGIVGFLAYLGIFASALYILWRNFAGKNISIWTAAIFSAILVAYFVQNLTVFDMVNSYMMIFLVLGFIASIYLPKIIPPATAGATVENKKDFSVLYKLLFVPLALMPVAFFYSVIKPYQADANVIKALREPIGSEERLEYYKKTLEGSELGKYQIRDYFSQTLLEGIYGEPLTESQAESVKKDLDYLSKELEKSAQESPLDFRSFLKLGQLYNTYSALTGGQYQERAQEILLKAIELSPTNQQGYWALAQLKLY